MSGSSPTVFIVDDDASFLRSLTRLLRAAGFVVSSHASAQGFLKVLDASTTGCVVTDLRMPGMDGLGLQQALEAAGHALPMVFLTGQGDIPTTVRAMRHGAEDFLTKTAPKEELLDAVRRALARDERVRAESASRDAVQRRFQTLTERERQVLGRVLAGKLNKQIAADLGLHERTVKLHRTAVTHKLGVRSVAELARLVQQAGLSLDLG